MRLQFGIAFPQLCAHSVRDHRQATRSHRRLKDGSRSSLRLCGGAMPGLAREFRAKAAAEFAAAEIATSDAARETHLKTARSYMTLADNEAWLEGERKQT